MSHRILSKELTPIRVERILVAAAQKLGLRVEYKDRIRVAERYASGHGVTLPGWTTPVVFNLETGEVAFDNGSNYTANHRDVKEGRKRLGEAGRWGDIRELDKLINTYVMVGVEEEALELGGVLQMIPSADPDVVEFVLEI